MSIIEGRPAAAWVVGEQPSTLLAMPEQVFWTSFLQIPQATRNLLRMLISRVRKTDAVLLKELERKVRYEILQRELPKRGKNSDQHPPNVKPLFPNHPQVEAYAVMHPAREIGEISSMRWLSTITASAWHRGRLRERLPAALFMVRVITLAAHLCAAGAEPAQILPSVNRLLCEANEESMFVTLAVAFLDTRTGKLTYLNGRT